jgi:hypothetical protein
LLANLVSQGAFRCFPDMLEFTHAVSKTDKVDCPLRMGGLARLIVGE